MMWDRGLDLSRDRDK